MAAVKYVTDAHKLRRRSFTLFHRINNVETGGRRGVYAQENRGPLAATDAPCVFPVTCSPLEIEIYTLHLLWKESIDRLARRYNSVKQAKMKAQKFGTKAAPSRIDPIFVRKNLKYNIYEFDQLEQK